MLKPPNEIKAGDKIILRDGKTVVTVTRIESDTAAPDIETRLFWEFEERERYTTANDLDLIEVTS